KFARSVMSAVRGTEDTREDFAIIDDLAKTANVAEPPAIREIRTAPVRHNTVCEIDNMQKEVRGVLGIRSAEE
ncbi:MAG: threonine synthase, partial [Lachnospiraceae bacterium]|nr:threonine synthase [Lachnospiraceae bacterium]